MVTSTFQYFPGVVVLHSEDLVHWSPIGHVITRRSQLDLADVPDSFGAFAPDISYRDGIFWVVVPFFHGQPRCTNYLFSAERPEGPYGDSVPLNHHFIDPSIFDDDDGRRYLVFGGGWVQELAADGSRLVGEARQVWPGAGGRNPEGPHLLKRDSFYYLLLAEGGIGLEHHSTLARSRSVWGPYEPCPRNPILRQTDPSHPFQKAGHGKFTKDDRGRWWMVHLGARRASSGHYPLGRETFLEPVEWDEEGWPIVGDAGRPVEEVTLAYGSASHSRPVREAAGVVDRFEYGKLDPEWEWVRAPIEGGHALVEEGLQIECRPYSLFAHSHTQLLTRRWRHFRFEVTLGLAFHPRTPGEEAGLALYRDTDAHLLFTIRSGVGQTTGQPFDAARIGERQERDGLYLETDLHERGLRTELHRTRVEAGAGDRVFLKARLDLQRDLLRLSYSLDGLSYEDFGEEIDARFLYPENAVRWHCFTAPRIGAFARGISGTPQHGHALFQEFAYTPLEEASGED